jgi:hypothetical protein
MIAWMHEQTADRRRQTAAKDQRTETKEKTKRSHRTIEL